MSDGGVYEEAYELAKLQAATDGTFDERLMRHWFAAAWDLCSQMVGLDPQPREINEDVTVTPNGTIKLSHKPSGQIRLYSCYELVAVLPPNSPMLGPSRLPNPYTGIGEGRRGDWYVTCGISLCCYCDLTAKYMTGSSDPCGPMPAAFTQAVCRLFCYLVENRGDAEMDPSILSKSGAKAFLSGQITYLA